MRRVLPLLAGLALLVAALSPHAHGPGPHEQERCAACVARGGEPAAPVVPDLAPADVPVGEVVLAPAAPPVTGAPLGAIPGQSPPAGA